MGPRIEPCGTPLVMCDVGGIAGPTFSACCLRLRSEVLSSQAEVE